MPMQEAGSDALFSAEYERELERWHRRRFAWLLGATFVWEAISLAGTLVGLLAMRAGHAATAAPADAAAEVDPEAVGLTPLSAAIATVGTLLILAITANAWRRVRPALVTREQTLRAANWLIVQIGAVSFLSECVLLLAVPRFPVTGVGSLVFFHFFSSVFMPWSPRESLRPMYPLISLFLLELVVLRGTDRITSEQIVLQILAVPFALLPGLLVCWLRLRRHRRSFDRKMMARGYFAMRKELSQARAVQSALFPRTIRTPELEFDYAYLPANEVGGDFVHASVDAKGRLDVVLMDVTGHGMASALTVARLSGEVERLLAEDPDIAPGQVLRALNRYAHLTLARHNVYLTALALQADPATGEVRYANAGHPPMWVRRGSGTVERFDATTWLLGATGDGAFDPGESALRLDPADVLVMVTDGVHEAPDRAGAQFGIERITETLGARTAPERWAAHLAGLADAWRGRIGDDDVLVGTIRCPAAKAPLPRARSLAEDIEMGITMGLDGATVERIEPKLGVAADGHAAGGTA
jgi:hypothetical protein